VGADELSNIEFVLIDVPEDFVVVVLHDIIDVKHGLEVEGQKLVQHAGWSNRVFG
jgi:hypothetical protein